MPQNPTPATEFAHCHRLAQPWHCDSQKTRNTKRLKCCACHAKWRWRSPKCCACHENCNSSSEIDAKILRLPHVGMSQSATPATRNEAIWCLKQNVWNLQKWQLLQNSPLVRPYGPHAETRRRLQAIAQRLHSLNPQAPKWNGNSCYAFGKKTCVMTLMTLLVSSPCSWEHLLPNNHHHFLGLFGNKSFFLP